MCVFRVVESVLELRNSKVGCGWLWLARWFLEIRQLLTFRLYSVRCFELFLAVIFIEARLMYCYA